MTDLDEQPFEYVVLRKAGVFVYKILPRDPAGYRADGWSAPIWEGRLQVIGKGDICVIRLLESNSDSLFATCIVSKDIEKSVERTIDSSRYFVIRLDDGQGRFALVGIGFSNRSDAFDFICAVNDFHNRTTESTSLEPQNGNIKDFALTGEQHVQIHIKNLHTKPINSKPRASPSPACAVLPPPSSNVSSKRRPISKEKLKEEATAAKTAEATCLEDPLPQHGGTSNKPGNSSKKKDKCDERQENYEAFQSAFGPKVNEAKFTKGRSGSVEDLRKQHQLMPQYESHPNWDAFSVEALTSWPTEKNPISDHQQQFANNPFADETNHRHR